MLEILETFFKNARGRQLVATTFLRLGLKVDGKGKIYVESIEIPPAKIARALGVDRRVVIDTAKDIAADDKLFQIFSRLESRAFVGSVAKELGFDTIQMRADPKKKGIVARVATVLANNDVSIRQLISDDPDLFPDPVLTIIIDGKIPVDAIKKLRELEFADAIMIR